MKHYLGIAVSAVIIAALLLLSIAFFFYIRDNRAGVGLLTITSLLALVLFSAFHAVELRRGS
ncbi:MAG: hypothetical protein V4649_00635 [Bacteroidota bacterium]